MKPIGVPRSLPANQRAFEKQYTKLMRRTLARITTVINRYADAEGTIPHLYHASLKSQVGQVLQSVFVGGLNNTAFGLDGVTPLAEYPRLLNIAIAQTVYDVCQAHHNWMKHNIPADVFEWLQNTDSRPLQIVQEADNPYVRRRGETDEDFLMRMADLRVFHPNPLAEIDPNRQWVSPHLWTDPSGYRLSDRVWNASQETRRKINNLLTTGLNNGTSALELSRQLEAYLIPGRAGWRTLRPYGRRFMPGGASFDAMRLARTEISRAHAQASYTASYLNPYVGFGDWRLSASHPKVDQCDTLASVGKGGERLKPAYDLRACPLPPDHPFCLCLFVPVPTDTPEAVTMQLRAVMQDARAEVLSPVITVAVLDGFVQQLLGEGLFYLFRQAVQAPLF